MLSVVIPAYNEAARIASTLESLLAYSKGARIPFDLVVISDGDDATGEVCRSFSSGFGKRLRVFEYGHRLGKGGAVLAGMSKARGDMLVFDADASASFASLRALEAALSGSDIVIGSRRMPGSRVTGGFPAYRRGLSSAFNFFVSLLFGLGYSDTQCGCKLFSASAVRKLRSYPFVSRGYEWDVEMLLAAERLGLEVIEFPIAWEYKRGGKATLADLFGMVFGMLRLKLSYL